MMGRPTSWSQDNAAAFQLAGVVEHYHLRAPYPSALAPCLLRLARPRGGPVLELGCGTGEIARALAPHVARVDAVDVSDRMLAQARTLPGGDHAGIRWIAGRAEDAPLDGAYALAVAGASLHWMDWDVVLSRVADHLAPGAVLAIVTAQVAPPPWSDALQEVIGRYSVIRDWQNADLIALLESRGVYERIGKEMLPAEAYARTIEEYIDGLHATSGLARERMGEERAAAFRAEVSELVAPRARDGVLSLAAAAVVEWGVPLRSSDRRAAGYQRSV